MIFNLLVIPLAAGYYILTRSFLFKFRQQRLDRQRILFETIILAGFILLIGFILKVFVYDLLFCDNIRFFLNDINPLNNTPYSGTVISSLILTIALVHLSNLFIDKTEQIYRAIKKVGNEFELIAARSFKEDKFIQITLKNDKTYVGYVKELPIPSQSNYLRLIPALSGYRDEQKKIRFTSHYLSAYDTYIEEKLVEDFRELETDVVIYIPEILTISFFDPELYEILK